MQSYISISGNQMISGEHTSISEGRKTKENGGATHTSDILIISFSSY